MFGEQKMLVELAKDLKTLAHKTGNINESVNNLTKIIYTDPDSLVNKSSLISEKMINLSELMEKHEEKLADNDKTIAMLSQDVSTLKTDAAKRDKIVNMVIGVVLTVTIPMFLFETIYKKSDDPSLSEIIQKLNHVENEQIRREE